MGGLDSEENLVKLTAREHFLIHWILVEIYRGTEYYSKLSHAWNCMCRVTKGQESRIVNSRYFKYASEERSKLLKNPKYDIEVIVYDEKSKSIKFEGHLRDYSEGHRTARRCYKYFQNKVTLHTGLYKGCTHFTKLYFINNEAEIRSTVRVSNQVKANKERKSKYEMIRIKFIKNEFICEFNLCDLGSNLNSYYNMALSGYTYKQGPKKGIRIELSN
jgi:hypothetical protein